MELEADRVSIDKIILVIDINKYDWVNEIQSMIDRIDLEYVMEKKEGKGFNQYISNWVYKTEDYTIFIGYGKTAVGQENRFMVQYNPNKVNHEDPVIKVLFEILFKYILRLRVSQFDVAFDYEGLTTEDLIIDKNGIRRGLTYDPETSNGFGTRYLGTKNSDVSVKIYDKASEEVKENPSLKEKEKTRIEYTIKPRLDVMFFEGYEFVKSLPSYFIKSEGGLYGSKGLTPKETYLYYAIENGFDINLVNYRDRKRYEELKEKISIPYTQIKPHQIGIGEALKNYISFLLSKYDYTKLVDDAQLQRFINNNSMSKQKN